MNEALQCAVRLLARREHSLAELRDKLVQKGYVHEEIQQALAACERQGLQSDARFAESLCRTRVRQGYGPVRIKQELQAKQVALEWIDAALHHSQHQWLALAQQVFVKKYNTQQKTSFTEKQKQRQFLLYRGFTVDMIAKVII